MFLHLYYLNLGIVWIIMSGLFLLALKIKNNSIADTFWGIGFVVITGVSWISAGVPDLVGIIISICVLIWASRLAIHIFTRGLGKGEDPRYAAWRKEWGRWFVLRSYMQIFLLQGFLMTIVALPVMHAIYFSYEIWPVTIILGLGIWIIGFLFEVVADWQVRRFIADKNNHGQLLTSGLWRYSRHPNYFGEAFMWWGIWIMTIHPSSSFYLTIYGPILITFLLRFVSGVPLTEARWKEKPGFEAYKASTNAFIPWFPKKGKV